MMMIMIIIIITNKANHCVSTDHIKNWIGHCKIAKVNFTKDFGIHLNDKLRFKEQITIMLGDW